MRARRSIPRRGHGLSFTGSPLRASQHTEKTSVPSRSSRAPRTPPFRIIVVLLVAAVAFALFSGSLDLTAPQPTAAPIPGATADATAAPPSATTAETLALLAAIPVKGRAPKTGYDREGGFGSAWIDDDRNGCDTRNDILARDLGTTTLEGVCRVLAGTLADPYTGTTIAFVRGQETSALVQIDHVVALSNAWQTGAAQISADRRIAFANDPLNLLAVDGATNSSKGDGDAATWLPPNKGFRCAYVSRQIAVKSSYALWVTPAEHEAMVRVLASCP